MKNTAFNHGFRAANVWKIVSGLACSTHARCIIWAAKRGLPGFAGRLPVPLACIALILLALAGGIISGLILLIISGFAYMLCNISPKEDEDECHEEVTYGTEWRSGSEGTGIYTGPEHGPGPSYRVNTDDYDDYDD